MAIYEVFSHPLVIRYKTSLCSKTTCFYIISTVFSVICPFFISYYSQGFWQKVDFYREQPDVSFKHKMLVVLETKHPDQIIFWSTYEMLNEKISRHFQQILPSVEHREEDYNRDGKNDELQMTISIPLLKQEVVSVKLILIFDYKLYLYSSFEMECAAYIHYGSSLAGATFSTYGELSLMQREPLKHTGKDERYNIPVVDSSNTKQPSTRLENILLNYMKRNITTALQNIYPVWEAGRAVNESFTINLVILYPEETILYPLKYITLPLKPGFQPLDYSWYSNCTLKVINHASYIYSCCQKVNKYIITYINKGCFIDYPCINQKKNSKLFCVFSINMSSICFTFPIYETSKYIPSHIFFIYNKFTFNYV